MLNIVFALSLVATPEIYGGNMLYPDLEDYVGGSGVASGLFAMQVCTQTADDTTPGVGVGSGTLGLGCNIIITNGSNVGATAITTFDDVPPAVPGTPGSILYVIGPATAANPTTIADAGNFELEYAWSAAGSGEETRVLVLECIAADTFVEVARHNGTRYFDDKIFVEDGNVTDFVNSQVVVSHSDTGETANAERAGVVGEAAADGTNQARGVAGYGETSTAQDGTGVLGMGTVSAGTDTTTAYGMIAVAAATHGSGPNVGILVSATGGLVSHAIEVYNGDVISTLGTDLDIYSDTTATAAATNDVSLATGAATNAGDFDSGDLAVFSGTTTTLGDSGAIEIQSGNAADTSGPVSLYSGTSANTGEATGGASLYSGDQAHATGSGSGAVLLKSGTAAGTGITGTITTYTGSQSNVGDVDSGDIIAYTGATTTDGDSGGIKFTTGVAGAGAADAGSFIVETHGANARLTIDGAGVATMTGAFDAESYMALGNGTALSSNKTLVIDRDFSDTSDGEALSVTGSQIEVTAGTGDIHHTMMNPGSTTFNTAATVHGYATSLNILEPNIALADGATVTHAATVRIVGAPTEGATSNFAFWVDDGTAQFDGPLVAGGGITMGDDLDMADYDILNPSQIYQEAIAADTSAGDDIDILGGNAYEEATGGNQVGGNVNIASGIGTRQVAIDDWNNCAGDTVTLTINGAATVCTESGGGCTWTAGVDDATTATSLAAGIDAVSGVNASATASVVYIVPDADDTFAVALAEGDATCTSLTEGADGDVVIHTGHAAITIDEDGLATFTGTDAINLPISTDKVTPTLSFGVTGTGFHRHASAEILMVTLGGVGNTWWTATAMEGQANNSWAIDNEEPTMTNPVFRPNKGGTTSGLGGTSALQSLIVYGESVLSTQKGTGTNAGNYTWLKLNTASDGAADDRVLYIDGTLNATEAPSGSDDFTAVHVNIGTSSVVGWDSLYLLRLEEDSTNRLSVSMTGDVVAAGTVTSAGMSLSADLDMNDYDILNPSQIYQETQTSDAAADNVDILSGNAYAIATGGNRTAADLNLAPGVRTLQHVCSDRTLTDTDTIIFTIDGAAQPALVESTDFNCEGEASEEACCDNLGAAIVTAAIGITPDCDTLAGTCYLTADHDIYIVDAIAYADGGVNGTGWTLTEGTDGNVQIWGNAEMQPGKVIYFGDNDYIGANAAQSLIQFASQGSVGMSLYATQLQIDSSRTLTVRNKIFSDTAAMSLGETCTTSHTLVTGDVCFGLGASVEHDSPIFLDDVAYLDADGDSYITGKNTDDKIELYSNAAGGTGYTAILSTNGAGYLAVGDTAASEPSMVSIVDGGADNEAGELVLYADDGNGNFFWTNTADVFRAGNAEPADDDAGGYAIMNLGDGTIGALTQPALFSNLTTDGLRVKTASGDTALGAAATLTVTDEIMRIAGNGGAQTLGDPNIASPATDGTHVCLQGTSDVNTVTIQDENTNDGSEMELSGNVNFTLGENDIWCGVYDSGEDRWIEMYRSDNTDAE